MINIRKLEAELWESADLLRSGSKLTSNQYRIPVLGLIFLRYAYSRYQKVEEKIKDNGCPLIPGAYVGVAMVEDDSVNLEERMAESNDLMDTISKNMKEMGL